jgi:hypothetical protein
MSSAGLSKKEAKRLQKKRERHEKKLNLVADGSWVNRRKRRNQRDFHCETRDSIHDMLSQTAIFIRDDGYRYVAPYDHMFQVYIKARWFGKTILDLMLCEFGGFDEHYYSRAIQGGNITINGASVHVDTVVKDGDFLQHMVRYIAHESHGGDGQTCIDAST